MQVRVLYKIDVCYVMNLDAAAALLQAVVKESTPFSVLV